MMVVQGMCLRHQWYWQYEEVEVVPVRNMLTTIEMCAWGFLDFVIPFRRVGCDVVTSCGRFERKKWTGEYISVPSLHTWPPGSTHLGVHPVRILRRHINQHVSPYANQ
jgi:esterase/lipase superfamily enzyme